MKISKYSKIKDGQIKATSIVGGGGSSSSTTIEGSSYASLDRTIWGKYDNGEDIDGHMTVSGDITIKAINYDWEDGDDDDTDGEDAEYDEGGGNLNVELKTTTKDIEVNNDAYIHKHLYINYPSHSDHSDSNKKCIGEIIKTVEDNIKTNADNIATNKTNIASNLSEINSLKSRVSTNETNIASNLSEINSLKTRVSTNETNIANNATNITNLTARVSTAETNISNNTTEINSLKSLVDANETNIASDISNLTARVSTNETNISNNATEINSLKSRVSTAETNISNNTTEINSLKSRVSTNETNITNLTARVSTNETNIASNTTNIANNTTEIENIKNQMADGSSVDNLLREIQTLKYGDLYNPVILYSGVLSKLSTSDIYTNNGCLKDCLQFTITDITQGLMTIEITPRYDLGRDIYCYVRSVDAIQEMSDDTRERKNYYKERSNGAHWFESWFEIAKNKTTIYLRELHNGNDDNDTWYSSSWFENGGIRAVNLTINGYVSFLN